MSLLLMKELDAEVAVKVLGWTHVHVPEHNIPELRWQWSPPKEHREWQHSMPQLNPPRLSTSIELAWLVIEEVLKRVRENGLDLTVSIDFDVDGTVRCDLISDASGARGVGDTAPEAICRAALEAVG